MKRQTKRISAGRKTADQTTCGVLAQHTAYGRGQRLNLVQRVHPGHSRAFHANDGPGKTDVPGSLSQHRVAGDQEQSVDRADISYPPTKVSQYAADTFDFAVERFEVASGETVPIYSSARAVVDAMRLGRAEERSLALSALNRYLRRTGQQGVADLQRAARELGGMSAIRPAIEAVLA
jgi:hypothetical protein